MKIGRNQPCPCGSGKKYKNCCLNKEMKTSDLYFNSTNDDFILMPPRKDYGSPNLCQEFFDMNPLMELSAARLVYSTLLSPEIEGVASGITRRFISRANVEVKRIKRETNPENLIKIMEQSPDPINHYLLKKKMLEFADTVIPKLIEKLRDNQNDQFVELSIGVIYESKLDCSSELLSILDSIKEPYTLSLVCLLLGLIGPKEAIKPVWDYYHLLKDKYSREESLEQGPLLALFEFKERFGLN